jgi:hypothetical protein
MPASTDYFTKVGDPGTASTLAAPGHLIGGTSITVVSTANYPTTTGCVFAIDTVTIVNGEEVRDAGSYTEWEGVVTGATTIESMVLRYGTDQNYPAGATTRVYIPVASSRENRLIDGLLVSLDQDGTLKADAVDNSAAIKDGVVTNAKLADDAKKAVADQSGDITLGDGVTATDSYLTKVGNIVFLSGFWAKAANFTTGDTVLTLPAGYRPVAAFRQSAHGGGVDKTGRVEISTAGVIIIRNVSATTAACVFSVSFPSV